MESSTCTGVNSLPNELLQIIHSYLPLEDQTFTMPKVSQIWRSISEENRNSFKEQAKSFLEHSIKRHDYNDDQINTIIKLFETNNFISNIKENNFSCRVGGGSSSGGSKIFSEKEDINNLSLLGNYHSKEGHSNAFHINWNPNTLKLSTDKGKWGDYRTSLQIRADVLNLTYQNENLFKRFELSANPLFYNERAGLISWKGVE